MHSHRARVTFYFEKVNSRPPRLDPGITIFKLSDETEKWITDKYFEQVKRSASLPD